MRVASIASWEKIPGYGNFCHETIELDAAKPEVENYRHKPMIWREKKWTRIGKNLVNHMTPDFLAQQRERKSNVYQNISLLCDSCLPMSYGVSSQCYILYSNNFILLTGKKKIRMMAIFCSSKKGLRNITCENLWRGMMTTLTKMNLLEMEDGKKCKFACDNLTYQIHFH